MGTYRAEVQPPSAQGQPSFGCARNKALDSGGARNDLPDPVTAGLEPTPEALQRQTGQEVVKLQAGTVARIGD